MNNLPEEKKLAKLKFRKKVRVIRNIRIVDFGFTILIILPTI